MGGGGLVTDGVPLASTTSSKKAGWLVGVSSHVAGVAGRVGPNELRSPRKVKRNESHNRELVARAGEHLFEARARMSC
jgi:hypothetical protein